MRVLVLLMIVLAVAALARPTIVVTPPPRPKLDVPYVQSPTDVVQVVLELTRINSSDMVYDLGCGDGRIVIAAAAQKGARGVGIDIDPARIVESEENARKAGVDGRVKFYTKDLFDTDLRDATVVVMYLLPAINVRLRPKLFAELAPGTRVASHAFDMGDWQWDDSSLVYGRNVYLWIMPAQVAGTWSAPTGWTLKLEQKYQKVTGRVEKNGQSFAIGNGLLRGSKLSFNYADRTIHTFEGELVEGRLKGVLTSGCSPAAVELTRK